MKKNIFFSFSILVLCFILTFSFIAVPLTAEASATATVAIGIYGAMKVVVSTKAIVAFIISSFVGMELSALLAETDLWLEQDPVLSEWANSYSGSLLGGEIIDVPLSVQESIRARYRIISPTANLSTLRVPYDLTRLEDMSFDRTFGVDVSSQLQTNNNLLNSANSLLSNIGNTLSGLASEITTGISSAFSSTVISIKNTITDIFAKAEQTRLNLWSSLINVLNKLEDFRLLFYSKIESLWNKLEEFRSNFLSQISNLTGKLEQFRLNVYSFLSSIATNTQSIYSQLEELIEYLTKFASDDEKLVEAEQKLNDIVNGYQEQFILFMNNSKDILAKYRNAFLAVGAVLVSFASLPIFSDLITFSIALGSFALFVNLANMTLSSVHSDSAKGKGYKSAKGG